MVIHRRVASNFGFRSSSKHIQCWRCSWTLHPIIPNRGIPQERLRGIPEKNNHTVSHPWIFCAHIAICVLCMCKSINLSIYPSIHPSIYINIYIYIIYLYKCVLFLKIWYHQLQWIPMDSHHFRQTHSCTLRPSTSPGPRVYRWVCVFGREMQRDSLARGIYDQQRRDICIRIYMYIYIYVEL